MLSWVVTCRSALRRSRKSHSLCVLPHSTRAAFPPSGCLSLTVPSKSFPLNLFADPHHLTRVPSIFYRNIGGRAARYRNPHPPLITRHCIQVLSFHILVHSFAACKIVSRLFSKASALFAKNHPGWGDLPFFDVPTFQRSNDTPVPLQRTHLGATIGKGVRNVRHPGKQLRSPRCLRIVSGHRGLFERAWSPLQVVPGSTVLTQSAF